MFDSRCGETHCLYPPLTDLFEALRQGPVTSEGLIDVLERRYDGTARELEDTMRSGLGQLRQCYLIEDAAEPRET